MLRHSPSCLLPGCLKPHKRYYGRLSNLNFRPNQRRNGSFLEYLTSVCGGVNNAEEREKQDGSSEMILHRNLVITTRFLVSPPALRGGYHTGKVIGANNLSDRLISQNNPLHANCFSQSLQVRVLATTSTTSKESTKDSTKTDASESNKDQTTGEQKISKSAKKVAKKGATKIRELFQKYGWTFVGTYASIYFMTLFSLFIAVNWGWMDPPSITFGGLGSESILEGVGVPHEDAPRVKEDDDNAIAWILKQMESYEWSRPYAEKLQKHPALINLGIAWVAVKFTEPLRLALAVAVTPRIARSLGMAPSEDDNDDEDRPIKLNM